MGRYMKLAEKEKALHEELDVLKKRVITNFIHTNLVESSVVDGRSGQRYSGPSLRYG